MYISRHRDVGVSAANPRRLATLPNEEYLIAPAHDKRKTKDWEHQHAIRLGEVTTNKLTNKQPRRSPSASLFHKPPGRSAWMIITLGHIAVSFLSNKKKGGTEAAQSSSIPAKAQQNKLWMASSPELLNSLAVLFPTPITGE